jgi:hypothetical protein
MLRWIEASVWWSRHSVVATCEYTSSASLSTHLQLTGGNAESEELGRYGLGNYGRMAPEDLGVEATPPGPLAQGCWNQTS